MSGKPVCENSIETLEKTMSYVEKNDTLKVIFTVIVIIVILIK